jgi:NAD(P)H dehydrogenase (quinone)
MLLVGVPFTAKELTETRTGGTPYGATHVAGAAERPAQLSEHERRIAQLLGQRIAGFAVSLSRERRAQT